MAPTFDLLPHAVLVLDDDGRIAQANAAAHELVGVRAPGLVGRSAEEVLGASGLGTSGPEASALGAPARASGRGRGRIVRADGTPVPVDYALERGRDGAWVLIMLPPAPGQLVEEARAILDVAFDNTPICAALFNTAGEYIRVNDNLCRMLGRPAEELLGRRDQELTHPEDREADVEAAMRILRGELDTWQTEKRFLRPDGSVVWAIANMTFLRDERGGPLCWIGQFQEITEGKRREAELERERRDLNAAQAVAGIGSWDYDEVSDRPGRWSLQLWRMLGLEPRADAPTFEEFVTMIHEADRDRVRRGIAAARAVHQPWAGEFRMLAADGRELHVAFRTELARDGAGGVTGAFGTIQDITERAERDAEQAGLRRIAELVAEKAPPGAVFATVANQVRQLFGAHSGMVNRFDPETNRGVLVSGYKYGGEQIDPFTFALDGVSASAVVYRTGRPASFDDYPLASDDPAVSLMADAGITGGVAAPIHVAGELWGTLSAAFSGGRPIPADAERRLGRFADLVAMAIANAEAWETLSRQAATDPITGLANHRTFYERLRAEVQRARRYRRDLSLVLLDLDHFKVVNDTFGHQVGDRVLIEVGRRLAREAREGELVARIGGEEFAWLMPETGREDAYQGAERIRRAIEAEPFEEVGLITISAGICAAGRELDGEDLVRFADRALYWAKDGGRNTSFVYTADAHATLSAGQDGPEHVQTLSSVRALARAIDSKDSGTGQHSERVAVLAERLALELGWTAKRARLLHACGLLHDVGKIGIPDEILLRPGPLTIEEYEQVKHHAELSAQIAAEVLEDEQVTWIRGHHERWDGSGYPDSLAGEEIPDGAQLLALADAWDVMTESRTYKPAKSAAEAAEDVRAQAGRQFAPAAVEALLALVAGAARVRTSGLASASPVPARAACHRASRGADGPSATPARRG